MHDAKQGQQKHGEARPHAPIAIGTELEREGTERGDHWRVGWVTRAKAFGLDGGGDERAFRRGPLRMQNPAALRVDVVDGTAKGLHECDADDEQRGHKGQPLERAALCLNVLKRVTERARL